MKKYSIKSKFLTIVSLFIFILSIQVAPSGNAAYTVTPKVGQCFSLTPAQVSAEYATKNPIKCSSTHNSETYEVAVWPLDTNPADMEYEDAISIVEELCDFWNTFSSANQSRWSKTKFKYWAWYTPNPAGWARGERWVRCDALIGKFKSSTSWPPYAFVSWKGSKI